MKKKSKKQYCEPLHLLIDGADGLGKTTICELLSKKLKIPVIKMTGMTKYFKSNPEEASEIYNRTIIQFKDTSFIMDRGWVTSDVYSWVYKRDVSKTKYLSDIRRKLNERLIILIGQSPFRGDKLVSKTKWKEINREYQIQYDCQRQKGDMLINVNDFTPQQICNLIIKSL